MTATAALPTPQEMRAFLARHYKHDRFEGRDTPVWSAGGVRYSEAIVASVLRCLAEVGHAYIGVHESVTGEPVVFDTRLVPFASVVEMRMTP